MSKFPVWDRSLADKLEIVRDYLGVYDGSVRFVIADIKKSARPNPDDIFRIRSIAKVVLNEQAYEELVRELDRTVGIGE